MDDKYNIAKTKPETRSEHLQVKIEELIKRRDAENDPAAKQKLHSEIMSLFAQYERAKL
ncbi:MAG: hypothetical protein ACR2IH_08675 [Pyrinomonadaceae bacterium]